MLIVQVQTFCEALRNGEYLYLIYIALNYCNSLSHEVRSSIFLMF